MLGEWGSFEPLRCAIDLVDHLHPFGGDNRCALARRCPLPTCHELLEGGVVVDIPPAQGRWGDAHVAPRAELCGEVSGVGADIGRA